MKSFKMYLFIAIAIMLLVLIISAFLSILITLLPIILPIILILSIIGYFSNKKQARAFSQTYYNFNNRESSRAEEGTRVFNDQVREFHNEDNSGEIIDIEAKEVSK